jgi:16S rRNA processing protein RimM
MLLVVGLVVRPHGIRGEVIVDVRTDDPEVRFAAGAVLVAAPAASSGLGVAPAGDEPGTGAASLTVERAKLHAAAGPGRLIVAFEGVYDRTSAESLRGVQLWVDGAEVPPTDDPDEFHDHQLVGLGAVTPEGEELGEVARVDHAPASDLLVLRRPDGRTALVPFVKAIVPEVDLAAGRVVITAPPGLFDL